MALSGEDLKNIAKKGGAFAVVSAAVFGALVGASKVMRQDDVLPYYGSISDPAFKDRVQEMQQSTSVIALENRALTAQEKPTKYAAYAAISALAGSFVAAFGADKFWLILSQISRFLGRVTKVAAKKTVKAAKIAAKATGEFLGSYGRLAFIALGLGVFALTGISVFDVQWEAGIAFGAAITSGVVYGWQKTKSATENMATATVNGSKEFGQKASAKMSSWTKAASSKFGA